MDVTLPRSDHSLERIFIRTSGLGLGEGCDGMLEIRICLAVGAELLERFLKFAFQLRTPLPDEILHGFIDQTVFRAPRNFTEMIQRRFHFRIKPVGGCFPFHSRMIPPPNQISI